MRNAGIQPTQLLQQHPPPPPLPTQSQQQQQQTPHQLHPGLQGHLYGNHIVNTPGGGGRGGDEIRDVWTSNLEQEFAQIRNLISQYPFVSMVRKLARWQLICRIQSFQEWLLDRLDSLKLRMSIIIRRCGVMSIYSR